MAAATEIEEKSANGDLQHLNLVKQGSMEQNELKQQEAEADEELRRDDRSLEGPEAEANANEVLGDVNRKKEPLREYKKRKRDNAGDLDFEVLMEASDQGQLAGEANFEESAAVAVGLKEDCMSSIEGVRFKEVLKRKSRIQEYLECRNWILRLWTKDVGRFLLVTDCGVSAIPSPDESLRTTLIRDTYEFLNEHGYINIGVVKRMRSDASELVVAESLDWVQEVDGSKEDTERNAVEAGVVPMDIDTNSANFEEANDVAAPWGEVTRKEKGHGKRKHVVVIGAGPAGLVGARHLERLNFKVTVLEARNRVGGRVFTDRSTFSVPVDLGASIITGTKPDAERKADLSTLICKQLGLQLTTIRPDCPMYDSVTGQKVPAEFDAAIEAKFNGLLDDTVALVAQSGDEALRMSLGEGLEQCLSKRKGSWKLPRSQSSGFPDQNQVTVADFAQAKLDELARAEPLSEAAREQETDETTALERRMMDWHFANLEYGCAAPLDKVSLPYWNQDEKYGGFAGPHCMIRGGFGTLMEALAQGLDVRLEKAVAEVSYTARDVHLKNGKRKQVRVKTVDGELYEADAVLLTVPLGCLKAQMIKFVPQLPSWKSGAISRLGFGTLNKVVLEFDSVFWDEDQEIFGAAPETTEARGRCFMFWNLVKTVDAPVLIALVVGKAALDPQQSSSNLVGHSLNVLRKIYGHSRVPEPKRSTVTDWGSDKYSRGAYSYVAVGSSGEDYDILARPLESCIFFAGEATCKEHPDTVGGALVSGLKEAVRIVDILEGRGYVSEAEAESMAEAQRQPESERNEVRDMEVRIAAAEYSNNLRAEGSTGEEEEGTISKSYLLKDMFRSAKTTAGRLFLAKEMLQLSAKSVKDFAGTKGGLSILNTWILDAMGKNGTQLLRLCIRLLLTVATDIHAVRSSGVGKTVKEKVSAHTSRDICLLAEQLIKVWIELYRREKLVAKPQKKGGLKLPKDEGSGPIPSDPACSSSQREYSQGNAEQASKSGATSSDGVGDVETAENEIKMSESEAAALREAEAYQAAALAAAEAYASAGAQPLPDLPKILSFRKFAKREKVVERDLFIGRIHKQKNVGRPDPRKATNWSGETTDSPRKMLVSHNLPEPPKQQSDGPATQQSEAPKQELPEGTETPPSRHQQTPEGARGAPEQIKRAVSDYVAQLLTPLYKTRKLQKDAFKAIAKKATMKVMERDGSRDSDVNLSDYMNCKRKNKIRALVDQLVEKHLADAKQSRGS